MKYAIISDIHGNNPALQLVIEDALKQGAQEFLFMGDYCVSAPWPAEVWKTIHNMKNGRIICGNEEQYLRVPEGEEGQFEISRWCKNALSREQRDWFFGLPNRMDLHCQGWEVHMCHSSEEFIGKAETGHYNVTWLRERFPQERVHREDLLREIRQGLMSNGDFMETLRELPGGIYIFGHTHIQWHMQLENHIFINPGSCGLPLDGGECGAPYTLLTIEDGRVEVEERRVAYDVHELIARVKTSDQYTKARVWSEVIFREWLTVKDKMLLFLRFVEQYARGIGDTRRPFAKDTWEAAYEEWRKDNEFISAQGTIL